MKKVLLVVLGALVTLLFVNRGRIYLCDPLAKVYKGTSPESKAALAPPRGRSTINGLQSSSHDEVENNSNSTVVADDRYGVVTIHGQSGGSDRAQNNAASGLVNLQSSINNAQQSSRTVLNLSDNSGLLTNDRKRDLQSGVQVFVNLSGNVLLERDSGSESDLILLQNWNKSAGTPKELTCIHWLLCYTDADRATVDPLDWIGNSGKGKAKYDPHLATNERSVWFVDGTGATIRIDLR
jgi:hypothetical protein